MPLAYMRCVRRVMTLNTPRVFEGDLVAGSLLLAESRKIGRLLLDGVDRDFWSKAVIMEDIFQKRGPATAKRQARLIGHRLELITPDLWRMVVEGNTEIATQALLPAATKHSRLLDGFLDQVVREHVWSLGFQLSERDRSSNHELSDHLDSNRAVHTRTRRLPDNGDYLFTFLHQEGVKPTNNASERALRPSVQWRKISFGNQSANGQRFTERILTLTRTSQLQNKKPFTCLCELMTAYFKRQSLPSLVALDH